MPRGARSTPFRCRPCLVPAAVLALAAAIALVPATAHAGRLTFFPTLGAWWEYSDNVTFVPEENARDKIADNSINVRPGAAILYESLRVQSRLGGSVTYQWYFDHPEEDGLPDLASLDAGVDYWLTPSTRVGLSDNLSFFYDPRDTQGTTAQEILQLQTASFTNAIQLAVQQIISRRSTVDAAYRFITNEFEDPALFDVVSHQAEAAWNERVSERHTIVVFGRYTRNIYSHDFDFVRRLYDSSAKMDPPFPYKLDTEADFDTYVPGLGLDYQMTATLTFSVRSGMILPARWINDREYQLDPIDWYQRLSATHIWRFNTTTLAYTRDLTPANGLESAVLSQDYSLGLQQNWTRQWQTLEEGGFNRALQEGGLVDAWRQALTVNYLLFRWLGLGAGYQHFEQFADFAGIQTHTITNRFLFTLSLQPPNPNWLSVSP